MVSQLKNPEQDDFSGTEKKQMNRSASGTDIGFEPSSKDEFQTNRQF